MTRNEYAQLVEAIAAIGRFHQAMTPAHLTRNCALCQSLDERRGLTGPERGSALSYWDRLP